MIQLSSKNDDVIITILHFSRHICNTLSPVIIIVLTNLVKSLPKFVIAVTKFVKSLTNHLYQN